MSCTVGYINGWGTCKALLKKMNGAGLQEKGNTWTDATAPTSGSWQTVIADDDSSVRNMLMLPMLSFVNTTDEPEILTSPLGIKSKGSNPIPSGKIMLNASLCDYKTLHALQGQEFEFIPFFQDGSMWMTRKSDGTLKGFRCSISTLAGLPPEDQNNSFPIYLFFEYYAEFEDVVVLSDFDWNYSDLQDFSPVGLDIRVTTAMSSGDVTYYVTKRGSGDPMTGLSAVGDQEVMKSNAAPVVAATVVVEDGQGYYTVTFKSNSAEPPPSLSANLSATEYIILQVHDDDATNLTYLSHQIKIYGG